MWYRIGHDPKHFAARPRPAAPPASPPGPAPDCAAASQSASVSGTGRGLDGGAVRRVAGHVRLDGRDDRAAAIGITGGSGNGCHAVRAGLAGAGPGGRHRRGRAGGGKPAVFVLGSVLAAQRVICFDFTGRAVCVCCRVIDGRAGACGGRGAGAARRTAAGPAAAGAGGKAAEKAIGIRRGAFSRACSCLRGRAICAGIRPAATAEAWGTRRRVAVALAAVVAAAGLAACAVLRGMERRASPRPLAAGGAVAGNFADFGVGGSRDNHRRNAAAGFAFGVCAGRRRLVAPAAGAGRRVPKARTTLRPGSRRRAAADWPAHTPGAGPDGYGYFSNERNFVFAERGAAL